MHIHGHKLVKHVYIGHDFGSGKRNRAGQPQQTIFEYGKSYLSNFLKIALKKPIFTAFRSLIYAFRSLFSIKNGYASKVVPEGVF